MPRPSKSSARVEMIDQLEKLQEDLERTWLDQSLPDGWSGLASTDPIAPPTTRVTLRLDSDMVAWFRKLGPGYQKRINRVLRIYWLSLICGHVKGYEGDDVLPRFRHAAREALRR